MTNINTFQGNVFIPDGNVGIGTTSTNAILEVYGPDLTGQSVGTTSLLSRHVADDDGVLNTFGIVTSNGGETMGLQTQIDGRTFASDISGGWAVGDADRYALSLQPYKGRVGIGTAAPVSSLHVATTNDFSISNTSDQTDADDRIGRIFFYNGTNLAGAAIESCVNVSGANNNSDLRFMTSLDGNNKVLERMRIDRQGRVGIGTDDPGELLDVNGTITGRFTPVTRTITHGVSGSGEVDTYTLAANENRIVLDNAQGTAGSSRTYTANFNSGVPTEVGSIMYLEINSSRTATSAAGVNHKSEIQFNGTSVLSTGDNFIGASGTYSKTISRVVILTSTLGWQDVGLIDYLDKTISKFSGWNTHCAQFERTSDGRGGTSGYGEVLRVTKDGTYQGSLDSFNSSEFGITSDNNLVLQQKTSTDRNLVFSTSYFSPFAVDDNTIDLGRSNARFDDVYATNSSIQTSDHNEKQDIAELSDAERRVAVACKGLLRKFRWKHSVAEKGDEARTHFGIIAQDLQAAFEAEGLDAGDYGMFIHSTWRDEEKDEEGNSFEPKRWSEEKSRMGVRYGELLAFIISVIE